MPEPNRVLRLAEQEAEPLGDSSREWLIANGLGGYACGTVTGLMTRRYHALLVAALPVPFGRTVMLDLLVESLRRPDGETVHLGIQPISGPEAELDPGNLAEFRLEVGLPVWRFEVDGFVLERRAVLLHRRNTVVISWRLLEGPAVDNDPAAPLRPFPGARRAGQRRCRPYLPAYRRWRPLRDQRRRKPAAVAAAGARPRPAAHLRRRNAA